MAGELTDDELSFLQDVLDLAREGRTDELADVIERGVPVNLTGATGDSLLILAAYHDHPPTVWMLLEHGADPHAGGRSAVEIAEFFELADMAALLRDGLPAG